MGRESRKTQTTKFASDDTNRHVTEVKCTERDDISGTTLYRCKVENANGVTTVEDSVSTLEMMDIPETYAEGGETDWDLWYADLDHSCEIHREGGGDIISCNAR